MGCIYIIRNNVNDMVYIGQTIHSAEHRFKDHLRDAYSGVNRKLYNAMRELGIENFYVETLVECNDSELNDEEIYYIDKYNSFIDGYNSTIGGSTGSHVYDNQYLKDLADSGLSKKEIMQIINVRKEYLCNIADFSDYTIETTSKKKALDMYDKHRVFKKSFESIVEAYNYINSIRDNHVDKRNFYNRVNQSCLLGTVAYEHIWRYKGNEFTEFDKDIPKDKVVVTCDICGKIIEKSKLCRDCYTKYLKYYEGMQLTPHDISDEIKKILNIHKCKNNNCSRYTYYNNEYCMSCANVMKYGKIPKPSKEEFISMINSGMTIGEIAYKYDRSMSTVSFWKKQYM